MSKLTSLFGTALNDHTVDVALLKFSISHEVSKTVDFCEFLKTRQMIYHATYLLQKGIKLWCTKLRD